MIPDLLNFYFENESLIDRIGRGLWSLVDSPDPFGDRYEGQFQAIKKQQREMAVQLGSSLAEIKDLTIVGFIHLDNQLKNQTEVLSQFQKDFNWRMDALQWQMAINNDRMNALIQEVRQSHFLREARGYNEKALEFLRIGLEDEALEYFAKALTHNKVDFAAQLCIGRLYLQKGDLSNAEAHLELAIKYASAYNDPSIEAVSYLHLGVVAYAKNEFNRAALWVKKSLSHFPEMSQANYDLARYLIRLDKEDEGLKHLRKAIEGNSVFAFSSINEVEFFGCLDKVAKCIQEIHSNRQASLKLVRVFANEGFQHYSFLSTSDRTLLSNSLEQGIKFPFKHHQEASHRQLELETSIKEYFGEKLQLIKIHSFYSPDFSRRWPPLWKAINDFTRLKVDGDANGYIRQHFPKRIMNAYNDLRNSWDHYLKLATDFTASGLDLPYIEDGEILYEGTVIGVLGVKPVKGKIVITRGRFIMVATPFSNETRIHKKDVLGKKEVVLAHSARLAFNHSDGVLMLGNDLFAYPAADADKVLRALQTANPNLIIGKPKEVKRMQKNSRAFPSG